MKKKKRGINEVKLKSKPAWSLWIKLGITFAVMAVLTAFPILLLTFKINSPDFLILISNIVYFPVMYLFVNTLYVPLYALGFGMSAKALFFSVFVFGVLLYFLVGVLIGWIIGKIKNKISKTNKHG